MLGRVNVEQFFGVEDEARPLLGGNVAYVVEEGHLSSQAMIVKPVDNQMVWVPRFVEGIYLV